jgi:hypothetical protein
MGKPSPRLIGLPLLLLGIAGVVAFLKPGPRTQQVEATPVPAPASAAPTTPAVRPGGGAPDQVVLRPLPVASESAAHEWTGEDATDVEVIQKIARNPDQAIWMIEENERIHRRQLVYRKETAGKLVQKARLRGEPVTGFILPSLDGHELVVEVISSDLAPSGQTGSFHGRLAGRPDSLVTLAFQFGREAFTVLSPEDDLYIQADPREPGELIVKTINPATYIQGHCGNPDHRH